MKKLSFSEFTHFIQFLCPYFDVYDEGIEMESDIIKAEMTRKREKGKQRLKMLEWTMKKLNIKMKSN